MRRSLSPAHWLVIVVPLVIGGFMTAHFLISSTAERVTGDATKIHRASRESASLSRVQGDLHGMGLAVGAAEHDLVRFDRDGFDRHRTDAAVQLAQLRTETAEPERIAEIARSVTEAETALAQAAEQIESKGAHDLNGAWVPSIQRADGLVEAAVVARAADIDAATAKVTDAERRMRLRAPLFHAGAGAFGVLLMLLATAAASQQLRLTEQRNALVAARATELEAFAGRVAHDLKNPLNTLALRAEVLQRKLGDGSGRHVEGILAVVRRMNEMIDALLAFARSGGRVEPDARADVTSVLADVLEDVRADAAAAGAEISIATAGSALVRVPPAVLGCVAGNLLRNAVKFIVDAPTSDRRIDVHVEDHDGFVALRVDDTGPGVPVGMESAIFEPFVRARSGPPGLGLGLATVRRLVESYGGSVAARRRDPAGSSFVVELPRAEVGRAPSHLPLRVGEVDSEPGEILP